MSTLGDDVVARSVEPILDGRTGGSRTCQNCDTPLGGPYCAQCGQHDGDLHLSVGHWVRDALDGLWSFDSRAWRTLVLLVGRPGVLTVEYWRGRRARYLPPLRLYLFVSFVMFLTLSVLPTENVVNFTLTRDDGPTTTVTSASPDAPDIEWDTEFADAGPVLGWMADRVFRPAFADPRGLHAAFLDRLTWALFLLVPVFAAFVRLLYRRQEPYFVPHLVLALHVHAATFLLVTVGQVGNALTRGQAIGGLAAVAVLWHLYVSLRRAYAGGWLMTVVKQLMLLFTYGTVVGLAIMVTLVAATLSL